MRIVVLGLIAAALLFVPAGSAGSSALRLVPIGQFDQPVYATATASEPGNLYVVERPGRVVVVSGGRARATPFLDIRPLVLSGGEQGLLSIAFDPDYASNRFLYVDYTDRNGDTRIVRYRSNGRRALPSSAHQLELVRDFASNHNGGQLQFGPDGRLYWGNGDGGGSGDPNANGQSLTGPFAKIQRLNVRAGRASWELVAYGLRNPWRFSFDRGNGDLYIGDVGQNAWEEIDYVRHGFATPLNFGWRRFEGTHVYDESTALAGAGRYVPPIHEYSHETGCSVTGGYVYRGHAVASAVGRYFFGDYCSGEVWSVRVAGGKPGAVRREPFTVRGLSSFGEDARGELYLMSVDGGGVYRLGS
jgi:glucose/arabinose dehydrogenase